MLKVSSMRLFFLINLVILVAFTVCFEPPHNLTESPYTPSPPPYIATSGSSTGNPYGLSSTEKHLNSTIKPHVTTMPTRTDINQDKHVYYTSSYYRSNGGWWFNIEEGGIPKLHEGLSKNIQYSDTLNISFKFPYYGHMINDVTITNKGYVFLGEVIHKFNTSAQYVAPLMADFTTYENTTIHYVDTGNRFTVEWANLRFQDKVGDFSFQCSILKNGTILFAYKDIPVSASELPTDSFPVRVGLSDSYRLRYIRRGIFIINKRIYTSIIYNVYYKYNTIDLPMSNVKSGSAFVITSLPNCVMFNSCNSCVISNTSFSCTWCPSLKRCSDGIDRHRHEWLVSGCTKSNKTTCPLKTLETKEPKKEVTVEPTKDNKTLEIKHQDKFNRTVKTGQEKVNITNIFKPTSEGPDIKGRKKGNRKRKSNEQNSTIGGVKIFLIVFILGIITIVICWLLYAYHHPQTISGRFLIKHRNPRKWFRNSSDNNEPVGGTVRFETQSHELRNS